MADPQSPLLVTAARNILARTTASSSIPELPIAPTAASTLDFALPFAAQLEPHFRVGHSVFIPKLEHARPHHPSGLGQPARDL